MVSAWACRTDLQGRTSQPFWFWGRCSSYVPSSKGSLPEKVSHPLHTHHGILWHHLETRVLKQTGVRKVAGPTTLCTTSKTTSESNHFCEFEGQFNLTDPQRGQHPMRPTRGSMPVHIPMLMPLDMRRLSQLVRAVPRHATFRIARYRKGLKVSQGQHGHGMLPLKSLSATMSLNNC